MNIELQIISGPRYGNTINLTDFIETQNSNIYILEDEAIQFRFITDQEYDDVHLCLHENIVDYTFCNMLSGDMFEYIWKPKYITGKKQECFFYNYFGIAELYLKLEVNNQNKYVFFNKIDVLSKKLNAERVNSMLSFLANYDSNILCSFFRVTRLNSGFKEGNTPAQIYFEMIEKTVVSVIRLVDLIIKDPITKLTNEHEFVTPNENTYINDQTISWICDNLDELYETDNTHDAILEYQDVFYSCQKIRESNLHNDTNVYENKVVHGFISTLKIAISELLLGFETPSEKDSSVNNVNGYVSFYTHIRKFQRQINSVKIDKCNNMLDQLSIIQNKLTHNLHVSNVISGIPSLTMKVKSNKAYLSLFNKIIDWNRFGSPDWSVQEELLSIKSIPKLFEYYILFYMKSIIDRSFSIDPEIDNDNKNISFSYALGDVKITLYYEPVFWMNNSKLANDSSLVNIENWTVNNGGISKRSHFHHYSNRSPDFVFSIESTKNRFYYILDAKYTYPDKGFNVYLPELTMKYLHGLKDSKYNNNIMGLTIITPNENPLVRHFHTNEFDLFSNIPTIPAMNVCSIQPGAEFENDVIFENVVRRILEIMLSKFNLNSNGKTIDIYPKIA